MRAKDVPCERCGMKRFEWFLRPGWPRGCTILLRGFAGKEIQFLGIESMGICLSDPKKTSFVGKDDEVWEFGTLVSDTSLLVQIF